jgi:predicted transcriptional regulator
LLVVEVRSRIHVLLEADYRKRDLPELLYAILSTVREAGRCRYTYLLNHVETSPTRLNYYLKVLERCGYLRVERVGSELPPAEASGLPASTTRLDPHTLGRVTVAPVSAGVYSPRTAGTRGHAPKPTYKVYVEITDSGRGFTDDLREYLRVRRMYTMLYRELREKLEALYGEATIIE